MSTIECCYLIFAFIMTAMVISALVIVMTNLE